MVNGLLNGTVANCVGVLFGPKWLPEIGPVYTSIQIATKTNTMTGFSFIGKA